MQKTLMKNHCPQKSKNLKVEKAMVTHSSTLAWRIRWTEEPGGLQSMGSLSWTRLSNFIFTFHFHALQKEMATYSSVLACRIPGTEEPGGLPSVGSHRVGQDWSDSAAEKIFNGSRKNCYKTSNRSTLSFQSLVNQYKKKRKETYGSYG